MANRVRYLKKAIRLGIRMVPNRVPAYRLCASLSPLVFPQPRDCAWDRLVMEGVPCYWLAHKTGCDARVILYLHGGGYVLGSPRTHLRLAAQLGQSARAQILMPQYRLAPEDPYPAALDDAVRVYRDLLARRISPDRVILAGDSAGGGLALSLALRLRDDGLPPPAAVMGISPWLDLSCSLSANWEEAHRDPLISPERIRLFAREYSGGADLTNPLLSPIFGRLEDLPPVLIQVGSDELLLPECRAFAERLRKAGGAGTLEVWPDMFHVWHLAAPLLREGRWALRRLGAFARERVPASQADSRWASIRTDTASEKRRAKGFAISTQALDTPS